LKRCYNIQRMTIVNDKAQSGKISEEFAARLSHLDRDQKVHAIVILRTNEDGVISTRRKSREERQAAINAIRESAQSALPAIDEILERFNGKRLATGVNALGAIAVETTASGITALAASELVKAILEDQTISSLQTLKRFR
jgi:beta-phosphoglucomutase-like phosphatase (HAD superfamily)